VGHLHFLGDCIGEEKCFLCVCVFRNMKKNWEGLLEKVSAKLCLAKPDT